MQAAHIGNKDTLTTTLQALDQMGMLSYRPSRSTGASRILMRYFEPSVTPEVGQPVPSEVGQPKPAPVTPEVGEPVTSELGQPEGGGYPSSGGTLLIVQTSSIDKHQLNRAGAPQKKIGEGSEDDKLSSAEVLDDNRRTAPASTTSDEPVPAPGAAPKKKVAPKKKGVGEQVVGATSQNTEATGKPRGGRRKLPETTFQESAIYDKKAFTAAFAGTDYELADLNFYHEKVNIWRDKKTGEPPRRADWVATAKRFMLNDAEDNRLKLAPAPAPQFGAGNPHGHPGGPDTGYRTSRWD